MIDRAAVPTLVIVIILLDDFPTVTVPNESEVALIDTTGAGYAGA